MKVEQIRVANVKRGTRAYCISHVYINGAYSHDTIEDIDRGLDESWTAAQAAKVKVKTQTAIPTGHYQVTMGVISPKFSQKEYYRKVCDGGRVPRLEHVVGFEGILIHCGVNERSSAGCVIVGYNKAVGQVTQSQAVFERIYALFQAAHAKGEKIEYIITRKFSV